MPKRTTTSLAASVDPIEAGLGFWARRKDGAAGPRSGKSPLGTTPGPNKLWRGTNIHRRCPNSTAGRSPRPRRSHDGCPRSRLVRGREIAERVDVHPQPGQPPAVALARVESVAPRSHHDRAERTCIATPTVSRWVDEAHLPNPFAAKWFGTPGSAWARRIYLPRRRMLELGSDSALGPVAVVAAVVTRGRVGDRSGAAMRVFLSPSSGCRIAQTSRAPSWRFGARHQSSSARPSKTRHTRRRPPRRKIKHHASCRVGDSVSAVPNERCAFRNPIERHGERPVSAGLPTVQRLLVSCEGKSRANRVPDEMLLGANPVWIEWRNK